MNNSKHLVSIIMNCYNGEKYLTKSVQSVINQSYKNWELIFWDNQSTDSSSKKGNSLNDRRIKYFRSPIKLTLGEARNFALEKCLGDFVCFLSTHFLGSQGPGTPTTRLGSAS